VLYKDQMESCAEKFFMSKKLTLRYHIIVTSKSHWSVIKSYKLECEIFE
jgi:hypothetical protein